MKLLGVGPAYKVHPGIYDSDSEFSDIDDTNEEERRVSNIRVKNIIYYIGGQSIQRRYNLFRYNCKVFSESICNRFKSKDEPLFWLTIMKR